MGIQHLLFESCDEENHINRLNVCRHVVNIWVDWKQDKTTQCVPLCLGVVPPVLGVRGTFLKPHEGVTCSAQRQTSDPVTPLFLRTVTQTIAKHRQ